MPDLTRDEDKELVAAEYVLGTLDADERARAQSLLELDQGFSSTVRIWERRLGELHLMVEAVEPDAQLWDRIKARIAGVAPSAEIRLPELPIAQPPVPASATGLATDRPPDRAPDDGGASAADHDTAPVSVPTDERLSETDDTAQLWRWRMLAIGASVLAAILLTAIATWTFIPDRVPAGLRPPFGLDVTVRPPPPTKPRPPQPGFDE